MVESSDFDSLLNLLQSADNEQRSKAEETFESIPAQSRLSHLLQSMLNSNLNSECKVMAAVLLRRLLLNQYDQAFGELTPDAQQIVKQQVLNGIIQETENMIRKKFADAAAELARQQFDDNNVCTWPEFIKFLFDCMQSNNNDLKEIALHMFTAVPLIFGDQQRPNLAPIHNMLGQSLVDTHLPIRVAGMRAVCSFVIANEDESDVLSAMKDLLPHCLQVVSDSLQNDPYDDTLLKCLVDLADSVTKFLRPYLNQTMELCFKILQNTEVDDNQRHLSLEVIISLSENAPAAVRKSGRFIEPLIETLIKMMTELEDDDEWSQHDEAEEDDDTSNAVTAEMALDRFACAMGGQKVLAAIIQIVSPMLASPDWKYRYAALMAVSACGEGCHKFMDAMLKNILDSILPFLSDPHARVRFAACNAVGQMSTDFGPKLQKCYHDKVIPALMNVLDDNANPRVQAHAGAAIVNFSENCPKNVLAGHLDTLMTKLEQVLTAKFHELVNSGKKLVLEQVVTSIASVADTAEEKFAIFYDRFMPSLKFIMEHAIQPELRLLRGKTIECISLIGLAVGKEKFIQDAADVMNLLLKTQTQETEISSDDPQVTYMISAWARICKLMGKDFEPYLPVVMGQVLKSAQIQPEVCLMDNEEVDSQDADIDWQIVKVGEDQNFAIKTSGLEDKATACQMLVCYARELKEGFAQYVDEVIKIMVPLLKFYFNDEVRAAASESLPYLLDCAQSRGEQYVLEMWNYILPNLLSAIANEPEREMVGDDLLALANCVEKMGRGCLSSEQMQDLYTQMNKLFLEHFEKHDQRVSQRQDEDYDEEEEERLVNEKDEDEYVLSKLSDVMHALFVTHKSDALPFFQQLMPHIVKLLERNRPHSDLQWGICFWDDVIEHAGEYSWQFHECFLPAFQIGLQSQEEDVRQSVFFGIGVAAANGGPEFKPTLQSAVPVIMEMVDAPNSRSEQFNVCTENGISALTKICKHAPDCLPNQNVDQFLQRWIQWLPVWEDKEETVHIYNYLCDLIEANHPVILGADNSNLPKIVQLITECIHKEGLPSDNQTYHRCLNIIRQIHSNEALFNACLSLLSDEQKTSLSKALQ